MASQEHVGDFWRTTHVLKQKQSLFAGVVAILRYDEVDLLEYVMIVLQLYSELVGLLSVTHLPNHVAQAAEQLAIKEPVVPRQQLHNDAFDVVIIIQVQQDVAREHVESLKK